MSELKVLKIERWLLLVAKARKTFTSEQYQQWQFIVGVSGTVDERYELGKRALELLRPKTNEVSVNMAINDGRLVRSSRQV